jgi:glycosyltransferase involved in cell wall biosynthesis
LKVPSKRLVISAVNLVEGGPLTILIDALNTASKYLGPEWRIIALVHNPELISNPRIKLIGFPQAKRSWLHRLWFEWYFFSKISFRLKPSLWLSLHDITPRVNASRQAVYCHNPSPFYSMSWREFTLEPKLFLFSHFYKYLYRMFMHRNNIVIVQQNWLRDNFRILFNHPNIVVARPVLTKDPNLIGQSVRRAINIDSLNPLILLYPSLPRVFKNFEVLCEAISLLPPELSELVELRLTIDGTENSYSGYLWRRFRNIPNVKFIGLQSHDELNIQYEACDVVLFPSRLETWGLPISEAKLKHKAILVADLPYAYETVGEYTQVSFLPSDEPSAWMRAIAQIVKNNWDYSGHLLRNPEAPFASDWAELWRILTEDL